MEDGFPLPTRGFQVPWDRLPGCRLWIFQCGVDGLRWRSRHVQAALLIHWCGGQEDGSRLYPFYLLAVDRLTHSGSGWHGSERNDHFLNPKKVVNSTCIINYFRECTSHPCQEMGRFGMPGVLLFFNIMQEPDVDSQK